MNEDSKTSPGPTRLTLDKLWQIQIHPLGLDLLSQGTHCHTCESNFAEFKISTIIFYVFVGLLIHLSYVVLAFVHNILSFVAWLLAVHEFLVKLFQYICIH